MSSSKKPEGQAFGVFEKDGRQVIAETIDTAVRLRFEGWQEINPPAPENVPDAN